MGGRGYEYTYDSKGQMIGYTEYDTGNQSTLLQATYLYNTKQQLDTAEIAFSYTAGGTAQSDMVYSYYEYRPYVGGISADGGDILSKMHLDGAGNDTEVEITYAYDVLYRMTEKVRTWNETVTMRESYDFADDDGSVYASTRIDEFTSTVGETSSSYSYTYDLFGNIQTITDSAGLITRYYYDDQQQLIRENNPYINTTYVYTYDRGGNRTSRTTYTYTTGSLSGLTGTTTNYTYDGDRLMSYGTSNLTYDDLGNPLTCGTFTYTWQNGRQLARVGYTGSSTEYLYEYNDSGIRTSKEVNGVKHVYTLNGSQIVTESWTQSDVEHVIVYLYDESGAPIGMQYRTSNYTWGEFDNYYFEKNLFGDVVAIYNESGTKIGSYKYDAWGVCNASVEPAASTFEKKVVRTLNPFRYRGYYYDTDTQFYYLQSRYYDPVTGRFLNADGYINANGDIIGYNMYAYCSNNPVMRYDPTGYEGKVCVETADEDNNPHNDLGYPQGGGGGGGGTNPNSPMSIEDAQAQLQSFADQANAAVKGTGPVAGTHKHSFFKKMIDALKNDFLKSEQSVFPNGNPANYGQAGSIRFDAALYGSNGRIIAVWDFKTGSAVLIASRIQMMQNALDPSAIVREIR